MKRVTRRSTRQGDVKTIALSACPLVSLSSWALTRPRPFREDDSEMLRSKMIAAVRPGRSSGLRTNSILAFPSHRRNNRPAKQWLLIRSNHKRPITAARPRRIFTAFPLPRSEPRPMRQASQPPESERYVSEAVLHCKSKGSAICDSQLAISREPRSHESTKTPRRIASCFLCNFVFRWLPYLKNAPFVSPMHYARRLE